MLPLLRSELFRFSRRAMPKIMLVILAGLIIGLYLLLWSVTRAQPEGSNARDIEQLRDGLRLHSVREFGFELTRQVGTVLAVIVGATAISNEFGWGTIRTLLPRASSRFAFLTAKLLNIGIFVVVLAVAGLLFALVGSVLVTIVDGGGGLDGRFAVGATFGVARTAFIMLPYVAIAFVTSTWTRSTAAGIAVALVVLFLEGIGVSIANAVGGRLADATDYLFAQNVAAIAAANRSGESILTNADNSDLPSLWHATIVLAAWTAALTALAYRRFLAQDITSG